MRTAKTLIRLGGCPGFVGFVMSRLIYRYGRLIYISSCNLKSINETFVHGRRRKRKLFLLLLLLLMVIMMMTMLMLMLMSKSMKAMKTKTTKKHKSYDDDVKKNQLFLIGTFKG